MPSVIIAFAAAAASPRNMHDPKSRAGMRKEFQGHPSIAGGGELDRESEWIERDSTMWALKAVLYDSSV